MEPVRDSQGRFQKAGSPPFEVGEVVERVDDGALTTIIKKSWNEKRGWIFGEGYIQEVNADFFIVGGGSGFWSESDKYRKPSTPTKKILAALITKKLRLNSIHREAERIESEMEKLSYAYDLVAPTDTEKKGGE